MTDFKRNRRKDEPAFSTAGGLPRGDARRSNKKVYGDALGTTIGFMDNLTPCRTNKPFAAAPHFHLDPRFMRVRDARCLSGHSDHYSYQATTPEQAKRLFFWYALARTFVQHKYPIWVDASEIWAPRPDFEPDERALSYALSIGLAENECIETFFPANNPIPGAPELFCTNPMAPNMPSSFWSRYLDEPARSGSVRITDNVIDAVHGIYATWAGKFRRHSELFVHYVRPYFVGEGILKQGAGLLQIRDYANEADDRALKAAFKGLHELVNKAKQEFHELLVASHEIDYFGETSSTHDRTRARQPHRTSFDRTLERRLALAGAIVHELGADRHLGRTKLAKVFYLADASEDLELQTDYAREAAGPLDPRTFYNDKIGIEAVAAKRGYFTSNGHGRAIKYRADVALPELLRQGPSIFGKKWAGIQRIIQACRNLTTEQSEIVATLFACWNDLLLERKPVNDAVIIREFLTRWHEKKQRFAKARLVNALSWMRKQELVPKGRGKHTRAKVRSVVAVDF